MMQRKKTIGNVGASRSADLDLDDDGGSAKQKPSNLPFAPRFRAALAPSLCRQPRAARRVHSSSFCLPGVPVVLKLILLSFLSFSVLVVFTAKGRHKHWRYGSPHMPAPILEKKNGSWKVKKPSARSVDNMNDNGAPSSDNDNEASSSDATRRMLDQPSRFVDSEKKLKRQLQKLMDAQNAEKKQHKKPKDSNTGVLGVKISTRYLGEDLLPYPDSKGGEKEWEKKMEQRKSELSKRDESEWSAMIQKYNGVMEQYAEENEHADHALAFDVVEPENIVEGRIDHVNEGDKISEGNNALRPPRGSKKWPSPSEKAGADTTILIKPAFGAHRPAHDAIFVFAEGYDLSIYLAFVESLVNTGYDGDVVFSISHEDKLKPGVKEYLQSHNSEPGTGGVNIVTYEVSWSCFKQSGEATHGANEGVSHCKMDNAFGDASGNPISDPREPRPVATARYEVYWMWSLQYKKDSWLMLIDARDVWFQLQPFQTLKDRGKVSGELHLFGENADVVRIGTSDYNRKWLITAYGRDIVSPFFDSMVICSGSTIGNQDAIETYLRAMVAEYDATLCKQKGCDQGFHNYLYYSGKLRVDNEQKNEGISKLIVHEQGKSIINNLGALRTKPLKEWGLYDADKQLILNWDGTTSAVAHQYDRDKEVGKVVKGKKREFNQQWNLRKVKKT